MIPIQERWLILTFLFRLDMNRVTLGDAKMLRSPTEDNNSHARKLADVDCMSQKPSSILVVAVVFRFLISDQIFDNIGQE